MANEKILCGASEKGKIVVNRCLEKGFFINTLKLQKLLILIHGSMLETYQLPFFSQRVIAKPQGLIIPEVDRELIRYTVEFKEKFLEQVSLLEQEEKIVSDIIENFGNYDIARLNEVTVLKVLKGLCYNGYSTNNVPRELIKEVFTDHKFYCSDNDKKEKIILKKTK